jgi:hypothetical protein
MTHRTAARCSKLSRAVSDGPAAGDGGHRIYLVTWFVGTPLRLLGVQQSPRNHLRELAKQTHPQKSTFSTLSSSGFSNNLGDTASMPELKRLVWRMDCCSLHAILSPLWPMGRLDGEPGVFFLRQKHFRRVKMVILCVWLLSDVYISNFMTSTWFVMQPGVTAPH